MRFAWLLCAGLLLVGCPRRVPHADAGPRVDAGNLDGGRDAGTAPRPDAGPLIPRDAGPLASNTFSGPVAFNDNALALIDPSQLPAGNSPCREPVLARVSWTSDGDTIHAVGVNAVFDAPVRLIGIDTPEIAHMGTPADCYGNEATAFTSQLNGHLVWLTFDNTCFDVFDRVLAYVHIGVDEAGFWQRQLLRRGFATEFGVGDNRKFELEFQADQSTARAASLGLWSACP